MRKRRCRAPGAGVGAGCWCGPELGAGQRGAGVGAVPGARLGARVVGGPCAGGRQVGRWAVSDRQADRSVDKCRLMYVARDFPT